MRIRPVLAPVGTACAVLAVSLGAGLTSTTAERAEPATATTTDLDVVLGVDPSVGEVNGPPVTLTVEVSLTGASPERAAASEVEVTVSLPESLAVAPHDACETAARIRCTVEIPAPESQEAPLPEPPRRSATLVLILFMPREPLAPQEIRVDAEIAPFASVSDSIFFEVRDPFAGSDPIPEFVVTPTVAAPGDVVFVRVQGLTDASSISITWSLGLELTPQTPTALPEDTVQWAMVLPRHDRLGLRDLLISSAEGRFEDVVLRDALLVVPRSVSDSRMLSRGG